MIKFKLLALFLIILLPSCKERVKVDEDIVKTELYPGCFEEHFELHTVVPVETNDDFLLAGIDRLISVAENYLIFSKKIGVVALIDASSGKMKLVIDRKGNGPGDSSKIIDIAYDEYSDKILIYNDYGKLLIFDGKGNFVSDFLVDGMYENIFCENGNVIFYGYLNGYSFYPNRFGVYNIKEKTWNIIGNDKYFSFPIRSAGRQLVKSKHLWFTSPLDFKLNVFDGEKVDSVYDIDFYSSKLSENLIRKANNNPIEFIATTQNEKIVYSINSVRETNNYLVFRTNLMDLCIYDKTKGKVFVDEIVGKGLFYNMSRYYCSHDGNDGLLLFVLPADKWMEYLGYLDAENLDEVYLFEKLKIKDDDNPILVFYKERESHKKH